MNQRDNLFPAGIWYSICVDLRDQRENHLPQNGADLRRLKSEGSAGEPFAYGNLVFYLR
jgi:hypothetical protein